MIDLPHFLGGDPQKWGPWHWNLNSVEIFVHCTYSPSFVILFNCSDVIQLTNKHIHKQTEMSCLWSLWEYLCHTVHNAAEVLLAVIRCVMLLVMWVDVVCGMCVCEQGKKCVFSHDCEVIKKPDLCKFYLLSTCTKGLACPYYHDILLTPCLYDTRSIA